MRIILIIPGFLLACHVIFAQNLDDLAFGSDSTLEVVSWNIEHFPKNDEVTLDYVAEIIRALDADILALQEINDTTGFRQMVDAMDEYEWFIHEGYYAGLAYAYKKNIEAIHNIYRIYTAEPYWRPFPRSPLIMHCRFSDNAYYIINNHFKCCGDGHIEEGEPWDEETRRLDASILLKEHIDENLPDNNVILTGDLNDMLTDEPENNVFQAFLDDSENYLFADRDIAEGPETDWSYPTWPSHLDHILITNELFDEMVGEFAKVQTIKIDEYLENGWDEYEDNVSDHRPVGIRFKPDVNSSLENQVRQAKGITAAPNPASNRVHFSFPGPATQASFAIFNSRGQKVFHYKLQNSEKSLSWDASPLPEGIYFARIVSTKGYIATEKVIINR